MLCQIRRYSSGALFPDYSSGQSVEVLFPSFEHLLDYVAKQHIAVVNILLRNSTTVATNVSEPFDGQEFFAEIRIFLSETLDSGVKR